MTQPNVYVRRVSRRITPVSQSNSMLQMVEIPFSVGNTRDTIYLETTSVYKPIYEYELFYAESEDSVKQENDSVENLNDLSQSFGKQSQSKDKNQSNVKKINKFINIKRMERVKKPSKITTSMKGDIEKTLRTGKRNFRERKVERRWARSGGFFKCCTTFCCTATTIGIIFGFLVLVVLLAAVLFSLLGKSKTTTTVTTLSTKTTTTTTTSRTTTSTTSTNTETSTTWSRTSTSSTSSTSSTTSSTSSTSSSLTTTTNRLTTTTSSTSTTTSTTTTTNFTLCGTTATDCTNCSIPCSSGLLLTLNQSSASGWPNFTTYSYMWRAPATTSATIKFQWFTSTSGNFWDVDNVSAKNSSGSEMITNGGFSSGKTSWNETCGINTCGSIQNYGPGSSPNYFIGCFSTTTYYSVSQTFRIFPCEIYNITFQIARFKVTTNPAFAFVYLY